MPNYKVTRRVTLPRDGFVELDYIDFQGPLIEAGFTDRDIMNFIGQFIRDGDIFVDVGANIGIYSVTVGHIIGTGHVVAFEPEEMNFRRLHSNIILNGLEDRVIPVRSAVSSKLGIAELSLGKEGFSGWHSLGKPAGFGKRDDEKKIEVSTTTLDHYFRDEKSPTLVKIDVEGHELEVLKGAMDKCADAVFLFEFNTPVLEAHGVRREEIIDFIKENRFTMFGIREDVLESEDVNSLMTVYDGDFVITRNIELLESRFGIRWTYVE